MLLKLMSSFVMAQGGKCQSCLITACEFLVKHGLAPVKHDY